MTERRHGVRWGRSAVVTAAVVAATLLVAAAPGNATGTASPAMAVTQAKNCGPGMVVRHPAATAAAVSPTQFVPNGGGNVLKHALAAHVRWLTTLNCKNPPGHHKTGTERFNDASANWSGYEAFPTTAFEAEAEWSVPAVSGNTDADFSSIWPGIGQGTNGTSDELIQAGTEQDTALGSIQTSFFWFEAFPMEPEEEITNLVPNILDSVGVEVDYTTSDRTSFFTICDFTQQICGQTSQVTPPPSGSAEMIVERTGVCPDGPTSCVPQELADFHTIELTDCFFNPTNTPTGVVASPIVSSGGIPITMTSNGLASGRVLAKPAAVAGDPSAFTDTWMNFF